VLQLLRKEARQRSVHVIVLLQHSSVLDAVQQASSTQASTGQYVEAVLGSAASSALTEQLRSAFDAQVGHSHAARGQQQPCALPCGPGQLQ
jgi:hypothetical protein